MKIKEGDKFTNPDYNFTVVCLSNKIDGRLAGTVDYRFGFFGGELDGKYYPSFFCLRLSKIKKKNGWKRA